VSKGHAPAAVPALPTAAVCPHVQAARSWRTAHCGRRAHRPPGKSARPMTAPLLSIARRKPSTGPRRNGCTTPHDTPPGARCLTEGRHETHEGPTVTIESRVAPVPPARRERVLGGPRTGSPGSRGTTSGTTARDAPVLARVHGLCGRRGTGPGPGSTAGPRIRPRHHASSSSGSNLTYRPSRTCGMRSLRACASTHEPGTPSKSPAASASTSAADRSPPLTTGSPACRPARRHAGPAHRPRARSWRPGPAPLPRSARARRRRWGCSSAR
jgi:hypothetical protein